MNTQDFTTGSISRKLTGFMLPIFGVLVMQAMYGSIDLLIVGKFGTDAGISAINTGSNVMAFLTFMVSAFSMAVTILIGQLLGGRNGNKTGSLVGSAICFFMLVAVVCCAVPVLFAVPIARLMKAPEETLALTASYIRICGGGYVFVVAYNFVSAVFRGVGDSKSPLYCVGAATIVNVVGDLILVGWLHMNVAGAAIATVAAQAVSVILSLVLMGRKKLPFAFSRRQIHFGEEIKQILSVGLPLVLQEILTNLTFLFICAFMNRIGLTASAGYGVASRIQVFVLLVSSSILQSMAAFVAQNVGAGNEQRARSAMKCGILIGCVSGLVIGSLTFFFGGSLSRLFTDSPEIIEKSAQCLRGMAADAMITSVLFGFTGYFNGHGKTKFVLIQGMAQSLLVRLPMAYFLSLVPGIGLEFITLSLPVSSAFGLILSFIYYRRMIKKQQDAPQASKQEADGKIG